MTQLDVKIVSLFNKMLYGGNYFTGMDRSKFCFNINGTNITMYVFRKSSNTKTENTPVKFELTNRFYGHEWSISHDYIDGYDFYINIEDRQYVVPGLSRIDEVKAIDQLEHLMQEHEMHVLDHMLTEIPDKVDTLNDINLEDF